MFNQREKTTFLVVLFVFAGFISSILGQNVILVKDSPAVLSFKPDVGGKKNLYVFVRGDNDELYTCFFEEGGSSWQWKSLGKPSIRLRVDSSPVAVAVFVDGRRLTKIARIFVRANNGHVFECEWTGKANDNPLWRDIWVPRNGNAEFHPSATFFDPITSNLRGPGFALAYTGDSDGNLSFHDGVGWRSLLIPRGVNVAADPGTFAITGSSWAYVVGENHQLYAHVMSNRNPGNAWRTLGAPPSLGTNGLTLLRRPALIKDPTRSGRLRVEKWGPSAFVVGGDRLWELHWQAQAAFWEEIGAPRNAKLDNSASIVIYHHDFKKPYIFTIGNNGALYSCTLSKKNPRKWFFHDHHQKDGLPLLAEILDRRPAVIAHEHFVGNDSEKWLYAFAVSRAKELVVCFWDKHQSKWRVDNLSR